MSITQISYINYIKNLGLITEVSYINSGNLQNGGRVPMSR